VRFYFRFSQPEKDGQKARAEYLADYNAIKRQLRQLAPVNEDVLEKLASFLKDITRAWD